ncbi:MerC family mercury resistance protein [Pyxidicoccus sp. 3LFB2]
MCLAAYGGVLASLGSSSWLAAIWGLPLTAAALLVTLAALAFPARRRRSYGPLLLGALGASTMLLGKFLFATPSALYVGASLLAAASIWSSTFSVVFRRAA